MLRIYLLRHGETTFNADDNRYCGRTDAMLTDKGLQQAEQLSRILTGISFEGVYSSPLKRASETAKIVVPNKQVKTDPRLIEMDFGNWEGKTRKEFIRENKSLWERWSEAPELSRAGGSGETALEVVRRVEDFFSEIRQKHPDGNILVVAHNTVNRLFLAKQLGMELKYYRRIVQENSSLTVIGFGLEEGFSLIKLNCRG